MRYILPKSLRISLSLLILYTLAAPHIRVLAQPIIKDLAHAASDGYFDIVKQAIPIDKNGDGKTGPGDEIEYRIVATNTSGSPQTQIGIQDGFQFQSAPVTVLTKTIAASQAVYSDTTYVQTADTTVAAGASITLTFRVRVKDSYPPTVHEVINQAGLTKGPALGFFEVTVSSNMVSTPLITADIRARKVAQLALDTNGNGTADPGDQIAYTIVVSNVGAVAATDLGMTDLMPTAENNVDRRFIEPILSSLTTSQGSITGRIGEPTTNSVVEANFGTLNAGSAVTIHFKTIVQNNLPSNLSEIGNQATIHLVSSYPGITATNFATIPVTSLPDLQISLSSYQTPLPSGEQQTQFFINYLNAGTAPATGVVITATLPPHSVLDAVNSTPGWSCPNTICTFALSQTVPPAPYLPWSPGTVTLAISPTASLPASVDTVTITARLHDDGNHGAERDLDNNFGTISAAFGPKPTLWITKTAALVVDANHDGEYAPGDVIEYALTVRNASTRDAHEVRLSDQLDYYSWMQIAQPINASQGTWEVNFKSIVFNIGTLLAGQQATLSFRASGDSEPTLTLHDAVNQAQVSDRYGFDRGISNQTRVPIYHDYEVTINAANAKSGDTPVLNGELLTYTISITNTGHRPIQDVRLNDAIDYDFRYSGCLKPISGTLSTSQGNGLIGESSSDYDPRLTVNLGSLNVSAVATITFQARAVWRYGCTQIAHQTRAISGTELLALSNVVTQPFTAPPNLYIKTSTMESVVQPGQLVTFSAVYGNQFGGSTTGGIITTVVPAYTTFNAAASATQPYGTQWDCADGSPSGTICRLMLPSPLTSSGILIKFVARVDATVPANVPRLFNQMSISDDGLAGVDIDPTDNRYQSSAWFGALPITATESAQLLDENKDGLLQPYEQVRFTLNVTNTSRISITGLVIDRSLPSYFSYIQGTAVLTAPDGVFPGTPTSLPFGIFARISLDVPLQPGQSLTATFDAVLNQLNPNGAQTPEANPLLRGVYEAIYYDTSSLMLYVEPVRLSWTALTPPTSSPTPTPTTTAAPATPTATATPPINTSSPTPTPTTTAEPQAQFQKVYLPVLQR